MKEANKVRAWRAADALNRYGDADERGARVVDLLTDLRHYCVAELIDFGDCYDVSFMHFMEEAQNE